MSDTTGTSGSEAGTPPPTVSTQQTGSPEPDPTSQPPDALASLDSMTPEQLDAIAQRVNAARENRPPSIAQQLNAIRDQIAEAQGQQLPKAIQERQAAKGDVTELEQRIEQLSTTLRRTEIVEAATAAGFKSPTVVADFLAGRDGDVTAMVTELAGTGAFQMTQPAQSAPIGGRAGSDPVPNQARQALIDEINRAHGRI